MPWPLVQPDPKVDPTPTMKPAITVAGMLAGKLTPLQSFKPSATAKSEGRAYIAGDYAAYSLTSVS